MCIRDRCRSDNDKRKLFCLSGECEKNNRPILVLKTNDNLTYELCFQFAEKILKYVILQTFRLVGGGGTKIRAYRLMARRIVHHTFLSYKQVLKLRCEHTERRVYQRIGTQ